MTKVLVIGGGGREHAIVRGLLLSARKPDVYCAPGNGGTESRVNGRAARNVPIAADDLDGLLKFAKSEAIDLTIVGPEDPLCGGIVDRFEKAGLRIFGPSAGAARIEGDKAFAKRLMNAINMPTADARIFGPTDAERRMKRQPKERGDALVLTGIDQAREYLQSRDEPVVVKAAGLAKGKGVFMCNSPDEAVAAAEKLMVERIFGDAGETIVVEERLTGREASVLALVEGGTIYTLETARDYKRALDGDAGPNTGGMGTYSAPGLLDDALLSKIESDVLVPIVDALARDDTPYRGVLYAGLMLTGGGPKVLEFNCRFGDPETQSVLMRLRTDLLDLFDAVVDGTLDRISLDWDPRPAVCVVMAAHGYPDSARTGDVIRGLDAATDSDTFVFHAGTRRVGDRIVTAGGRVLGVTALGDDVADARRKAYAAADRITFDGAHFRRDIAAEADMPIEPSAVSEPRPSGSGGGPVTR
jgi:phosphoribosylamine--glycine ligase